MFSKKYPFTAVTVAIERVTDEEFEEDDLSDIPALVEAINLQATGPSEAARAIRKKLKYGNAHKQLRALTILDALIQNGGSRSQRIIADEMLLERLRICATSEASEQKVRNKCNVLFRSWAVGFKNTRGMEQAAALYKQLPRRKPAPQEQPKPKPGDENPFGNEDEEEQESPDPNIKSPSLPPWEASSSTQPTVNVESTKAKKDKKRGKEEKKKKGKKFDIAAERSNIQTCIAESSVASTNLLNALRLINRERERVSENPAAVTYFNNCEKLQRKIQRYVYLVDSSPEFLGALLHANDELGTAINSFKQLDSSIDADSDSEDEMAEQQHIYNVISSKGKEKDEDAAHELAGLHIGKSSSLEQRPAQPPRPKMASPPPPPPPPAPMEEGDDYEDEDENDPFADRNALNTPKVEKGQPVWREV